MIVRRWKHCTSFSRPAGNPDRASPRGKTIDFTLCAATTPSYLHILGGVPRLIGKAESFCSEKSLAPKALIQGRLAEDMLSFAYQVKSTAVHSLGAIEGVRKRTYSPGTTTPPDGFEALHERVAQTELVP